LVRELLEFVDDVVDDLGSRKEIEHIHAILERGTSADAQLRVFEESGGKHEAIVEWLVEHTMEHVPEVKL
jgi:carboxylate-amine ligase